MCCWERTLANLLDLVQAVVLLKRGVHVFLPLAEIVTLAVRLQTDRGSDPVVEVAVVMDPGRKARICTI